MKLGRLSTFNRLEKINFVVTSIVRMLLVVAIGFAIIEGNYFLVFISSLTLILTVLPIILEKKFKIDLPPEFEIIIVLFLYASLFLGIGADYYIKFWWWDIIWHGFGGVALGLSGFLILFTLHKNGHLKTNFLMIAFLSFCFALALGSVWEIYEFSIDSTMGNNMQKARNLNVSLNCDTRLGVIDTMNDLILDSFGALIACSAGYIYLKNGSPPLFARLIRNFEKINPKLFQRD
ncbi:MAG: hypothetical protein WC548_00905 [Candidatus Pacearchaeota archaeon]